MRVTLPPTLASVGGRTVSTYGELFLYPGDRGDKGQEGLNQEEIVDSVGNGAAAVHALMQGWRRIRNPLRGEGRHHRQAPFLVGACRQIVRKY